MRVYIKDMEKKHLDRVAALDLKIAQRPWSLHMFLEELKLQSFCRVLLDDYGSIIGYSVARLLVDEWHLLTIGVGEKFQNSGYGHSLVMDVIRKAALSHNRSVLLEVRASNKAALSLYEKIGFKTLYIREGYYKSSPIAEDAIVMDRRIQDGDREIIS